MHGGPALREGRSGTSIVAARARSRVTQKILARRCLVLATLVYLPAESDWRLIGTYVNHALGRLAYGLGRTDEAALHFLDLLVDDGDGESDAAHLDDFKQAFSVRVLILTLVRRVAACAR